LKSHDLLLKGGNSSQAEALADKTGTDLQEVLQAWLKLQALTLAGSLGAGVRASWSFC
jgi:hypothetical protein